MLIRQWQVEKPAAHSVMVEHWRISGKARISVDGNVIYQRDSKLYDTGFEHRFKIDGLPCIVRAMYRTWCYEYELWMDGKLQ
jgi:hypothetical protein